MAAVSCCLHMNKHTSSSTAHCLLSGIPMQGIKDADSKRKLWPLLLGVLEPGTPEPARQAALDAYRGSFQQVSWCGCGAGRTWGEDTGCSRFIGTIRATRILYPMTPMTNVGRHEYGSAQHWHMFPSEHYCQSLFLS